jgi:hypothetical protein
MSQHDSEEKRGLLKLLFKFGNGTLVLPLEMVGLIIRRLGTVRIRLGERP